MKEKGFWLEPKTDNQWVAKPLEHMKFGYKAIFFLIFECLYLQATSNENNTYIFKLPHMKTIYFYASVLVFYHLHNKTTNSKLSIYIIAYAYTISFIYHLYNDMEAFSLVPPNRF